MGAKCCVAARDKPSPARDNCDVTIYSNVRGSPTWSLRWDNRTHIEDTMENPSRTSTQHSSNFSSEIKSFVDTENERTLEGGSSSLSIHTPQWRKKLGTARSSRSFFADQSPRSNFSSEEKYSFKSPSPATAFHTKLPMSIPSPSSSSSSFKTPDPSLMNPTHHFNYDPSSSKKSRWSSKHMKSTQTPDNNDLPVEEYHDSWSMQTFSELVTASAITETHPFGTGNPTSNTDPSPLSCKICSKLMKERSPWSAQKIVSTNELAVAAVLVCGHVYHADCLENITPDIDRYDPQCPVCSNGDKFCSKLKLKGKISRRAIAELSSSVKRPFLKRHFSVGSGSVSVTENEGTRKKSGKGFWRRYNSKNW